MSHPAEVVSTFGQPWGDDDGSPVGLIPTFGKPWSLPVRGRVRSGRRLNVCRCGALKRDGAGASLPAG